jgi:putative ABC transport system permease protein
MTLAGDLKYGLRVLRRSRGFAALSVLTLALGIGATTAVFSVVNAVLLRELPYRQPDRLVFLYEPLPGIPNMPLEAWGPVNGDFFEWQKQTRSFAGMAMLTTDRLNVSIAGSAFRAHASRVTADFFRVLGVPAALGRTLDETDMAPGKPRIVVISHAIWLSRFGGDRGVLGKELLLDAQSYRIVGVMPAGFSFPHGAENLETHGLTTDFWSPLAMTPEQRAARDNSRDAIARLRPGVSLSQAQAELSALTARFDPPFQEIHVKPQAVVRPFAEGISGGSRRALLIFMAAVFLVLLIACSNVAGLALARAGGRRQEICVRAALGASRWHLVRQMLAESIWVALGGGVLGSAAAWLIVRVLANLHSIEIPRLDEASIDARVLAFAVLVSIATALLSGLFPAWSGSRSDLNNAIKASATRSIKGGAGGIRRALMVAEIALTVVLLAGSALLIRSFLKLRGVDKGFSPQSTVSMNVELYGRYNQPQTQNAFFRTLLDQTRGMPGIQDAAAIDRVPLGGGESISMLEVEGYGFGQTVSFESRSAGPRYFRTMEIPLLEGREFDDRDGIGGALSIIVSRSFAHRYFPGRSALGHRVHTSGWRTIVGVVADIRQKDLDVAPPMQIYLPLWQTGAGSVSVVVRSALPAGTVASTIRGLVRNLDPALALANVRTMDELVSEAGAPRRFQTLLLTAFGAIALFLSLVGLYGLMTWSVGQRTAEIGVRMALGAKPGAVMSMVLRQGAALWIAGMALGLACAWAATRWLQSLLFEVQPADPPAFVGVVLLFFAVAAGACYFPARRATRVDPAVALRHE